MLCTNLEVKCGRAVTVIIVYLTYALVKYDSKLAAVLSVLVIWWDIVEILFIYEVFCNLTEEISFRCSVLVGFRILSVITYRNFFRGALLGGTSYTSIPTDWSSALTGYSKCSLSSSENSCAYLQMLKTY